MIQDQPVRINKYLSASGICSRRKADKLVDEKRISINGVPVEKGTKVFPGQQVCIDGIPIEVSTDQPVLLLVNKPKGIVCTTEAKEPDNVISYLNYPSRIYPIGRLDKESRGLLLMTNVGYLHNEITRASNMHEKEYIVKVNKRIDSDFIRHMSVGVYLSELQVTTMPAKVSKLSEKSFSIIIHEGKNRQIRRMCRELSYNVIDLKRIRIMHFLLDGIEEGTYRHATKEEWKLLNLQERI